MKARSLCPTKGRSPIVGIQRGIQIGIQIGMAMSVWMSPGMGAILPGSDVAIATLTPTAVDPGSTNAPAELETAAPRPYNPLRQGVSCPGNIAILTNMMMRDIPSYTNRVLQRTVAVLPWTAADEQRAVDGLFGRQPYRPSHVLIAGNVNLSPLDLNDYAFTTDPEAGGPLRQVFFTTLSRQYAGLQTKEVQEYHWLFLTDATDGWRLAFMFSQIESATLEASPTPPRESSLSSVGQAVQLWLRDCRASAVVPLSDDNNLPFGKMSVYPQH